MSKKICIPELVDFMAVDIGRNTALAVFDGTAYPQTEIFSLPSIYDNIEERIKFMTEEFKIRIKKYDPCYVILEGVELWRENLKSLTSTTSGHTFWLAYLVGAYAAVCIQYKIPVSIVRPSEWKGQLSKDATKRRVKRINNTDYKNEHVTDAVAIGFAQVNNVWNLIKKVV